MPIRTPWKRNIRFYAQITMSRQFLFFLLSIPLLIIGCTSKPTKPAKQVKRVETVEAIKPHSKDTSKAQQLMQSGNSKEAARIYQKLAVSQSSHQNMFRLLAADALLQSGNINEAQSYTDSIDPGKLSAQQRIQLNLIYAQLNLSSGAAEQAIRYLDLIPAHQLNSKDRISYHQSRAFAYSLTGQLLKSARERIQLSKLITNPEQLNDNYSSTLETLTLLPADTLRNMQPPPPDVLGGWMALAAVIKLKHHNPDGFESAIRYWRYDFPGHPADSAFLDHYLAKSHRDFLLPDSIAIFLPETGPYARAAQAVREGFLAAYHHQENISFSPRIRFYDTQSTDPVTLYKQAQADGAELIIGPLDKKNISLLADNIPLDIPVLALNHIPGLEKDNLYQFGLSPIDDVEQVTNKARIDGHRNALILVPETSLGERLGNLFAEYWQGNDDVILETQSYNPKSNDFSNPIKHFLNLDESERRYKKIRRLIPSVKFTPRRRHDVDVIFFNASPNAARLINPQLQFYRAKNIPIYATHHVYSGRPASSRDQDLNGITFCDIPWLFNNAHPGELSLEALQEVSKQFPRAYLRLIALGIDAYNLIPHLDEMEINQYSGATGNLLLSENYRIQRNLICAKFSNGVPKSMGFIESYDMLTETDTTESIHFNAE